MKTCTKCGETKPKTDFYKNAGKRDGLASLCKACSNDCNAKWQKANLDKVNAKSAKYRASNPDKQKAAESKWRAANLDKARAATSRWREANPDKAKDGHAKWLAANPEANRIYCQNRRARKLESGGNLTNGLAARLFKLQRGKCACGCKQPLGTDYHLDHIMPLALGGTNTDSNIQLLRASCNHKKHAKHPVEFMQSRGFLL